jgi:hypothetical protein
VDPAGHLAQFVQHIGELVGDLTDPVLQRREVRRHRGRREAQLEAERDEALLGPVVQIPFDAPAIGLPVLRGRVRPAGVCQGRADHPDQGRSGQPDLAGAAVPEGLG